MAINGRIEVPPDRAHAERFANPARLYSDALPAKVRPIAPAQDEKLTEAAAFVRLVKGKEKWLHRLPKRKTPREAAPPLQ
jgi:hypothetical protein